MEEQTATESPRLIDQVSILLVTKRGWAGSKTIKSSSVNISPLVELPPEVEAEDKKKANPAWLYISKALLSSKKLNAIWAADDKLTARLDYLAVPSPLRGSRLVPFKNIPEAEKALTDHGPIRKALVDAWCDSGDIPTEIDAAKESLGDFWKAEDYPTVEVLRATFSYGWQWLQLGASEILEKAIDKEFFEREQLKAQEKWDLVGCKIEQMQLASATELVNAMVDKLTPDADGKPKRFRATSFNAINDYLAMFRNKNVTNYVELEAEMLKIEALLAGVDPESVKSSDGIRDKMRQGFETVKAELDQMIESGPRRKVKA